MSHFFLCRLAPARFGQRLAWALAWLLLLTGSHGAWAQLSGAYTINSALVTGARNYVSFTDAVAQLNTVGVNGPVTFAVSGGPYTEQVILNAIAGSSAINTVTFNGGGSTIQYSTATAAQRAVIQLNGATYVTLNNLSINAAGGSYGWGMLLTNAANNNTISNCTITSSVTATSTDFAGIVVSGSTTAATTAGNAANNLTVQGNTIVGGYYGITLIGASATALASTNRLISNTVRDAYYYGIYATCQSNAQIFSNDINRLTRTAVGTFVGIYLGSGASKVAIEKNRIHDTGPVTSVISTFYGININSADATAGNEIDVINNVIYNIAGVGEIYGFYNISSDYVRYYHNTLSLDNATASTSSLTYGFYQSVLATGIEFKNNVISLTRNPTGTGTKYALYFNAASVIASDYNDLYVLPGTNAYTGYRTSSYATLAQWQATTAGYDAHSVQTDPAFVSAATGNLTPTNTLLNNVGTPLARVTDDITGAARSATPDLGAYEFSPTATDLAPQALVSPAAGAGCYGATQTIVVQVRNAGTTALNFATNPATVMAVVTLPGGGTQTLTGTVTTGTLASGATQNVTLTGTFSMVAVGTYSFAITATVIGDQNTGNDTLTPAPSIAVTTQPTPTLSSNGTVICGGSPVVLTSSAASGNQFLLNGAVIAGATGTTYSATAAGSYTVQATTAGGCSAASTAVVLTTGTTPATPTLSTTGNATVICGGNSLVLTSSAASGNQFYLNGAALSGATGTTYTATAAGTYSVTVTNAGGCSATSAPVTLTASFTPPSPTLSSSGTVICGGSPVVLTSSAASGNQFLLNGTAIAGATGTTYSATTAGSYTVTATNAGGCSATSASVTLTASPTPATPTLTAATQPSGAVLLASNATTGNQFYRNGVLIAGATSQTYLVLSGNLSGAYTVVATSAAGCASAPSAAVQVTVLASAQVVPGTSLRLAPNPTATGSVTLLLTNVRVAATLTVLNALGQTVYAQDLSAAAVQAPVALPLAGLASGVYLVRVTTADGTLSQRLVRE